MDKPYYVMLTGSKNNAGDFLIKHRAKELFSWLRPDREVIDLNAWEILDSKKLDIVNGSCAVILTGGPSLQKKMYPGVYALCDCLDSILPPMVTLGVGGNSLSTGWSGTHGYVFTRQTQALLTRLSSNGLFNSVRDYHTLNILNHAGVENVSMTGCPAIYRKEFIGSQGGGFLNSPRRIGFSLGACFKKSGSLERQTKSVISSLRNNFPASEIIVAFHHPLDNSYFEAHGASKKFYSKQLEFAEWVKGEGFSSVDVSGSADKLSEFYDSCDLHVGYRVHAHLYCLSSNIPSFLIAEDGRGAGQLGVLGGGIPAFSGLNHSIAPDIFHKLGLPYDRYKCDIETPNDVMYLLRHGVQEKNTTTQSRARIDALFPTMKQFISQLP